MASGVTSIVLAMWNTYVSWILGIASFVISVPSATVVSGVCGTVLGSLVTAVNTVFGWCGLG